jgi:hypothetical protein
MNQLKSDGTVTGTLIIQTELVEDSSQVSLALAAARKGDGDYFWEGEIPAVADRFNPNPMAEGWIAVHENYGSHFRLQLGIAPLFVEEIFVGNFCLYDGEKEVLPANFRILSEDGQLLLEISNQRLLRIHRKEGRQWMIESLSENDRREHEPIRN